MYTVNELEDISGVTRRTIGDYISKGLLSGPSHRGRGARYSQSDADVLQIIPRLRTVMKKDFPSLREVQDFLNQRSAYELHSLARKTSEPAFELEVRTLRLQSSVTAILPHVPPEKISHALKALTPEQITGVDTGRYQIGAVIDMAGLLAEPDHEDAPLASGGKQGVAATADRNGHSNGNGHSKDGSHGSWSVNWLDGTPYTDTSEFDAAAADISALESISQRLERMALDADMDMVRHESADDLESHAHERTANAQAANDRLADIAKRVERLEQLLETK